ncbi:MAG: response regulator [Candidatus Competibacteraceae bacterium]|nr:response regulator [Candidatus Competibacteraceae bacterium]
MARTATVLTIDDERAVREIIAAYLEDSGFQVIQAQNGLQGIELCRSKQPDLVLCDLRMPEMDGLQVLTSMTQEFPEIPIIVVSGAGVIGDAIEALKLGAWDYVTKPIEDMAVLEHAMEQALERAQLLRENREYREHLETANAQLKQSLRQLEEDEEAGRRIQFRLLPQSNQIHGPYCFDRQLLTSLYLSGDFVDYFSIDSQHLGFYMADVSGHGVSSAFVTVLLRSYVKSCLERFWQAGDATILNPAKLLKLLNQEIFKGRLGKYLTIFYGVIDQAKNSLRYSNGGQFPFPILADNSSSLYLECKGLPVGLFEFADYHDETRQLPQNFVLLLISDGILEVLPDANLQQKLDFLLLSASSATHSEISIDSLTRQLELDQASTLPDDITILLIKRQT